LRGEAAAGGHNAVRTKDAALCSKECDGFGPAMVPGDSDRRPMTVAGRARLADEELGSDLVRTAEGVRRQQALLESTVESIDGSVFSLDTEFRHTGFNTAYAQAMRARYCAEIELERGLFEFETVFEMDEDELDQNVPPASRLRTRPGRYTGPGRPLPLRRCPTPSSPG
jgi:hypothetical protein